MNNSDYHVEFNKRLSRRIEERIHKLPQSDNLMVILNKTFELGVNQSCFVSLQMSEEGWIDPEKEK
ncbi:hypothetical protein UFOVP1666_2 [uncultured Caudovirales phage]|uniref:Uncharacterized protein n=1 Tax=uncultured Caudovirales phage TaxID=2100421 RepID=A0A6J5PH99_9CAUD|nr:hypothetical protein UFOVP867_155 [uncultured Caudovirales phage]CAB4170522.1 hypothetical protein UFOVP913_43 [uncultured Caudovirales phage]CAB4176951.1 hypothetical protein UFOVP993_96 [uncultured Caudovirales phage]CAB4222938.1 hypothetical protein UFOVP1666_2 [uncultured Caudovirales phage]